MMSNPPPNATQDGLWRRYFDRALARESIGDLLMLVEEAPTPALQVEARRLLGQRLMAQQRTRLAREQFEAIVRLDPEDAASRQTLARLSAGEGEPPPLPSPRGPSPSLPRTHSQAILFSGHMIDAPNRATPRFPPDKEALVAEAIAKALDELHAGSTDLAICGGACGGDTLFAEAAQARGLYLQLHLQFEEPEFLTASVSFAGPQWIDRYHRLAADPRTTIRIMPRELGPPLPGVNPYERNNLWQLSCALADSRGHVQFLSVWDGRGGDGPGGTKHMMETVRRYSGAATILDLTALR